MDSSFSFGPFCLIPARRLLLKGGQIIEVGNRVLDVLIALVEVAGDVVGHNELLKRAWPNVVVNEGSLRVTIASLRKDLGDGRDGARYIVNVTGRGYCFVAPVTRSFGEPPRMAPTVPQTRTHRGAEHRLPTRLARLIGRDEAVQELITLLLSRRFVSVVGPGGMGKTTVAVSVAHDMRDEFRDAVYFADLSAVVDPEVVPNVVASALGLFLQAEDPIPTLLTFLAGNRVLLIIDNCEHVIDAAASLAQRIYSQTPQTHILTTSRESLRVEGEQNYLLAPLAYPSSSGELTASQALEAPAVQLFMDRAFAAGYTAALTNQGAPLVADICARLDGIAFAIELAASRVAVYGIQGTADLLSNRFKLLWEGRRSAPPRQQTLAAMLDWSYNLLSNRDRRVLGRLSIFVGVFTLEAAQSVASGDDLDPMGVAEAVFNLIKKSLVLVVPDIGMSHYRLLDSTLAYAAEKLSRSVDRDVIARKHALYFEKWLLTVAERDISAAGPDISNVRAALTPHIGNVRAALAWCFATAGDREIGARLAAAAAKILLLLSLLTECKRWCEEGLAALADEERGPTRLALQSFLAASSMFARGNGDEVRAFIEEALGLAESLDVQWFRMHLLVGLGLFLTRGGDFKGALAVARRGIAVAEAIGSPPAKATGESLLGVAYHLIGDQRLAQRHCERSLVQIESSPAEQVLFFGEDHEIHTLIALARCYWLIGFPDRAAITARRVIDLAAKRDHPLSFCMTLIFTSTVFLWRGDFAEAEQLISRLVAHAEHHSIGPYHSAGLALSGELAIALGRPGEGTRALRRALGRLEAEKYDVLGPALHAALANGLMMAGEIEEASAVVQAGLDLSKGRGETLNISELLRLRGELWLRTAPSDPDAAEHMFRLSLQEAKAQSALSFELRSALRLAELWSKQGRPVDAVDLVAGIRGRFKEGFATADLIRADGLLASLRREAELAANLTLTGSNRNDAA